MRIILALAVVVTVTYTARSLPLEALVRPGDEAVLVLGFVLLGSFLCGELAARIGLPLISGYLLAGVVFGPLSARLFSDQLVAIPQATVGRLRVIDDIALGLIAFTAGGEIEISSVPARGRVLLRAVGLQSGAIFVAPIFALG